MPLPAGQRIRNLTFGGVRANALWNLKINKEERYGRTHLEGPKGNGHKQAAKRDLCKQQSEIKTGHLPVISI